MSTIDRRQYRRIQAPLYVRPAGVRFLSRQRQPVDISLGGVRIYSDEPMKVGELLKLEAFLPDESPTTYTAEVVWIEPLGSNAGAKFDVGLKFVELAPEALGLLVRLLGPPENG